MNVLYAKMSTERRSRFKINTKIVSIDGKKYVLKSAMTAAAKAHIQSLVHKSSLLSDLYGESIHIILPELYAGMVKYEYIEGEVLANKIRRLLENGQQEDVLTEFRRLADILSSHAVGTFKPCKAFRRVFGDVNFDQEMQSVNPANIDINFDNIIVDANGKWNLIDCEWTFEFSVPIQYIWYRAIFVFSNISENFRNQLYCVLGIDRNLQNIFSSMEASFTKMVSGTSYSLEDYSRVLGKDKEAISHCALERRRKRYIGKCYFDCDGLTEENIMPFDILSEDIKTGRFLIPQKRWQAI